MRFLASGDHHFDEHSRFTECIRIHDWMIDQARERQIDLFLSAGDMYERASTPTERQAVADWLVRMGEVCPVVLVRGNHDRPRDVELLSKLRATHPIIVCERDDVHDVAGARVACVPWPFRAELAAAVGRGASSEEVDRVAREAYRAIFLRMQTALAGHTGPKLLLTHAMIDGSITSVGQPLVGCELNVGLSDLALSRADLVIAGHIHCPQEWTHDGVPIVYTGSPRRTAFGEHEVKGVVLGEYSDGQLRWERVTTPATPMVAIEWEWASAHVGLPGDVIVPAGFAGNAGDLEQANGAEIRFRYHVEADQRDAAKAAAGELRDKLLAAGAVLVKLEEEVEATTRARAPEISNATTTADKLDVVWGARDFDPGEARAARLRSRLAQLEDQCAASAVSGRGSIRFDRLRGKGLGTLADFDVDLTSIPGKLVAITGPNGAGKSTLLEVMAGALFRKTPTRGSLGELASRRDAFVEVEVVNGASYRIRQTVDSESGKGEALVLDAEQQPAIPDTKVTSFDLWAGRKLPQPEVFYTTQFLAQQETGFLDMKEGDRKAILLRTLGVERYEELARVARASATEAQAKLETLLARVNDEQARGLDVVAAEQSLTNARTRADQADQTLEQARASLAAAQERARVAQSQRERAQELRSQREAARSRLRAAEDRRASLGVQLESVVGLLARAAEIESAKDRLQTITTELADLQAERARVQAEFDALTRDLVRHGETAQAARTRAKAAQEQADNRRRELSARLDELQSRISDLDARLTNNRAVLARADEIRAAVERDAVLQAELVQRSVEQEQAAKDRARAVVDQADHDRRREDASRQLQAARQRRTAALDRLAERALVTLSVESLPQRRTAVDAAEHAVAAAEAELERVRGLRVAGAEDRIVSLRGGYQEQLDLLGDEERRGDAMVIAERTLATDDAALALAKELPARVEAAQQALSVAVAGRLGAQAALAECQRKADRAPIVAQAEADLEAAKADEQAAVDTIEREQAASAAAAQTAKAEAAKATAAAERQVAIADERPKLAPQLSLVKRLETAEARIAEIEPQVTDLRAEHQALAEQLAAVPAISPEVAAASAEVEAANQLGRETMEARAAAQGRLGTLADREQELSAERSRMQAVAAGAQELAGAQARKTSVEEQIIEADRAVLNAKADTMAFNAIPEEPATVDTSREEQAAREAEQGSRDAHAAIAVAEVGLRDAQARQARLEAFTQERRVIEDDLADWNRLASDLGRDGMQALEIDAAGPKLAELTNDLLHTCVGPRWTVSIETTRPNATCDRQIECCDIMVMDAERGRTTKAERLSGGERVIISEAISLALSMLACNQSGASGVTLIRDESGAALDAQNGPAYIAMLRRAADIVGASKVLFVSHAKEVQDLADSKIVVRDGRVEV